MTDWIVEFITTQVWNWITEPTVIVYGAFVLAGILLTLKFMSEYKVSTAVLLLAVGFCTWTHVSLKSPTDDEVAPAPAIRYSIEVKSVSEKGLHYGLAGRRTIQLLGCKPPAKGSEAWDRYYEFMNSQVTGKTCGILKLKGYSDHVVYSPEQVELNRFLLAFGIVEASDDAPKSYRLLAESAQEDKLGIYGTRIVQAKKGTLLWLCIAYFIAAAMFAFNWLESKGRLTYGSIKNQ